MEPLSMTSSDLWSRFHGQDIFQHWIYLRNDTR